ncbi:MAG TPA: hypothetical protein VFO29_08110 [Candidatus Rubrimentiphilum sp.]|nr:hypothetical protein [Candidatus Rubrimentiphilum sp.]
MRPTLLIVATLAALVALPATASASISIAAGGFTRNAPTSSGGAVIVSTGASIPAVPLEVQASLLTPIGAGGGYAATGEIRGFTGGGFGGAYIGAGAGVSNLSSDHSTGPVLTIFAGKSFAPFTSLEIRLYRQTKDAGATAGFLGVRFSF